MELDNILLIIATVGIFAHGYAIRKKYTALMLIITLLLQVNLVVTILDVGAKNYIENIWNVSMPNFLIAVTYTIFFWVSGYIVGGINLNKKGNKDELDRSADAKYIGFDFDDEGNNK